jgi:hypothetical protein
VLRLYICHNQQQQTAQMEQQQQQQRQRQQTTHMVCWVGFQVQRSAQMS